MTQAQAEYRGMEYGETRKHQCGKLSHCGEVNDLTARNAFSMPSDGEMENLTTWHSYDGNHAGQIV